MASNPETVSGWRGPAGSQGRPETAVGVIPEGVTPGTTKVTQMMLIDQLINWMLVNPGKPMTDAAHQFKFSATWLRTVVSSDAFRARLAEKQAHVDAELLIPSLRDKLKATAERAIERLAEHVEVSANPEFILDATEMLLKQQYGVGGAVPPPPTGVINVDRATIVLLEERDKLLGRSPLTITQETDNAQSNTV